MNDILRSFRSISDLDPDKPVTSVAPQPVPIIVAVAPPRVTAVAREPVPQPPPMPPPLPRMDVISPAQFVQPRPSPGAPPATVLPHEVPAQATASFHDSFSLALEAAQMRHDEHLGRSDDFRDEFPGEEHNFAAITPADHRDPEHDGAAAPHLSYALATQERSWRRIVVIAASCAGVIAVPMVAQGLQSRAQVMTSAQVTRHSEPAERPPSLTGSMTNLGVAASSPDTHSATVKTAAIQTRDIRPADLLPATQSGQRRVEALPTPTALQSTALVRAPEPAKRQLPKATADDIDRSLLVASGRGENPANKDAVVPPVLVNQPALVVRPVPKQSTAGPKAVPRGDRQKSGQKRPLVAQKPTSAPYQVVAAQTPAPSVAPTSTPPAAPTSTPPPGQTVDIAGSKPTSTEILPWERSALGSPLRNLPLPTAVARDEPSPDMEYLTVLGLRIPVKARENGREWIAGFFE